VLAGSTDIGLWVNKQFRDPGELIYIGRVAELQAITSDDQAITIGAAATLEAAWAALAARWPGLREVGLRFASLPVRSAGTMGGNVANGSPIGDSAPVLIALGAQIVLRHAERQRTLPLEDFYLDYMKNALQPGEFVQALVVPLEGPLDGQPGADTVRAVRGYKISKRFDSDISAVCMGWSVTLQGERIADVRIACGGMAATVRRALQAEAALRGQPWNEATLQAAQRALALDYQPLSDLRASAAYRLQVAQNLLRRAWLETRPVDPLPATATSVWARVEAA
jgi:xanthine dehydrogenase small subunit